MIEFTIRLFIFEVKVGELLPPKGSAGYFRFYYFAIMIICVYTNERNV